MKSAEVSPKSKLPLISLANLNITLKPNCLLTRRPLCFLTPPRSLFYYKNPWLWISSVLYEHGYKVEIFQLPFQDLELKKLVLKKNFSHLQNKHLIVDSVTYMTLKNDLENIPESTLTIIGSIETENTRHFIFQAPEKMTGTISYYLHRIWCRFLNLETPEFSETLHSCSEKTWHAFLEHCVYLAEIDFEKELQL